MSPEFTINDNQLLRSELLNKLHGISFCAFLTVLTSEMCLEVVVMTSKGTCYSWVGYGDWRVYRISKAESAKLEAVGKKISAGHLKHDDLDGTCLKGLASDADEDDADEDTDLLYLFSDFATKEISPGEECFCYYDESDNKYYFFSSETQISAALNNAYSEVDTKWEEMDTNDLNQWWDRFEAEGGTIPFCYFGDNE